MNVLAGQGHAEDEARPTRSSEQGNVLSTTVCFRLAEDSAVVGNVGRCLFSDVGVVGSVMPPLNMYAVQCI